MPAASSRKRARSDNDELDVGSVIDRDVVVIVADNDDNDMTTRP